MGEQHRHVVDGLEALALERRSANISEHPHRLHAEGRLARLLAGHVGPRPVAGDDQHVADAQLLAGDHRAVDLDLVALRRDGEVVGELDLRHDEAVLRGELAAHLADALRQLAVRREQRRRELLAEAELDLGGLQRLLDRVARLLLGRARRLPRDLGLLGRAQLGRGASGWRSR